jgi:hypothetical protein
MICERCDQDEDGCNCEEHDYMLKLYESIAREKIELDWEMYALDMVDAGRGHLLRERYGL